MNANLNRHAGANAYRKSAHALRSLRHGIKYINNELVLTPYELTLSEFVSVRLVRCFFMFIYESGEYNSNDRKQGNRIRAYPCNPRHPCSIRFDE
jgi:hypothetical protein